MSENYQMKNYSFDTDYNIVFRSCVFFQIRDFNESFIFLSLSNNVRNVILMGLLCYFPYLLQGYIADPVCPLKRLVMTKADIGFSFISSLIFACFLLITSSIKYILYYLVLYFLVFYLNMRCIEYL